MKILVTAFEPFCHAQTNISEQVLACLEDVNLQKLLLPVSFLQAPELLRRTIEAFQPDFIVSMGQCGEGDKIRLERFAHNLMDAVNGDNDGFCPHDEVIKVNAPLALQTALPVRAVHEDCLKYGFPVMLSSSAGLYVCNRVYYEALFHRPESLFVHIPANMHIDCATSLLNHILEFLKTL